MKTGKSEGQVDFFKKFFRIQMKKFFLVGRK
jgi:hypothetical protein